MNYRRFLIVSVTFLGGIYYFLEFVLPQTLPQSLGGYEFGKYNSQITNGFIAVGAVAFLLGFINLLFNHGGKIIFKKKGFVNSLALLGSMFIMLYLTSSEWIGLESVNAKSDNLRNLALFAKQIKSDSDNKKEGVKDVYERSRFLIESVNSELTKINSDKLSNELNQLKISVSLISKSVETKSFLPELSELNQLSSALSNFASANQDINLALYKSSLSKKLYDFVYEGLFVPLGSAMFSLLGFYIISAGYRAFRVKNIESGLMMIAAVVVMLGQIPFYIYISSYLPDLRLWLLQFPSAAAFRAIKFGAAIAGLYMAIRMWFSIETSSFVKGEKK